MRPKEGHKRSPAALPRFPKSACTSHILSSWSTRSWECKRNHEQLGPKADSDVVSESRLELARKQAFENFISIDGQAQVLDTIFSREERQRRRKRYHASFRSVGDCLELLSTRNEYLFSTAGPRVALEMRKHRRYPECLPVGPRRTLRQKAWSSAAGAHLSKLEAACTEFLLAAGDDWRALSGITQDGRTKFVERTRALEIGAASVDAPHKRDPRRQMSVEANLSRMQHVRWWLGFGANRLFCPQFTVITQLPVVVPDDNPGLTMHFGSGAGVGRHNFPRQATLAEINTLRWPSGIRQLGKPDT